MKMRDFSQTAGGMNIVVRHLESMIRIAEGKYINIQLMRECIFVKILTNMMQKLPSPPCSGLSFRLKNTQPLKESKRHSSSNFYRKNSLNHDHFAFLIKFYNKIYKNHFYSLSCLRGLPLLRIGFTGFS